MTLWQRWDEPRQSRLKKLWTDNVDVKDIADQLGTSRGAIYLQANKLGLPRRRNRGRPRSTDQRPPRAKSDPTKQRRFAGVESHDGPKITLAPYHPASREGTTFFPSTVRPASMMVRLLKSGEHSRKIGAQITKGRWKGMPIFTLTLEERETCPRNCLEWATCYGNNMHFAQRISDDGTLTRRLWGELASLAAAHPAGFVVRLHVLGDFYSTAYVAFWRQALVDFPPLRVFGFTARDASTDIGKMLSQMAAEQWDRFAVRLSGGGQAERCSEVVDKAEDATGLSCPAESDPDRCCATCGLCWATTRTISFVRH